MGFKYVTVKQAYAYSSLSKGDVERNSPELYAFAEKVCNELKAKWVPKNHNGVWVYRPNELYTLGHIGYGDFYEDETNSHNRKDRYMVCSPNIVNSRYTYHCDQFFMTMVKSMTSGVKKARTYMRTVQPAQVVKNEYRNLREEVEKVRRAAKDEYTLSARPILSDFGNKTGTSLEKELMHLHNIGHKWLDPSFATNLEKYLGIVQENKAAFADTYTSVFVDISPREYEEPKYIVTRGIDARRYSMSDVNSDQVTVYDQHTMPEELGNKVHSLNILNEGQFVPDVGMHAVKGRLFYVAE